LYKKIFGSIFAVNYKNYQMQKILHFTFIILFFFNVNFTFANDNDSQISSIDDPIVNKIISCLKAQNIRCVGQYFANNIEMTLLNNKGNYSRSQAMALLDEFFIKFPIKSISDINTGNLSSNKTYVMCKYESGSNIFKIYFILYKEQNESLSQILIFNITK
jgi:hypothetical protein